MKILKLLLISFTLVLTLPVGARAAGCAAHASDIAASSNARVLAVSTFEQGGATMCRITVLIPSRDGGPARKKTIVVRK